MKHFAYILEHKIKYLMKNKIYFLYYIIQYYSKWYEYDLKYQNLGLVIVILWVIFLPKVIVLLAVIIPLKAIFILHIISLLVVLVIHQVSFITILQEIVLLSNTLVD